VICPLQLSTSGDAGDDEVEMAGERSKETLR